MAITTPNGRIIEAVEVVTPEYLEARLSSVTPTDIITRTELEDRISDIPVSHVTQHDLQLAATAVDAKFDMLRSAIQQSTDFDTLKARLLAVLE